MKVVILAGGRGTRIAEESHLRPKPMIETGGRPMLWHIMKGYAHFGLPTSSYASATAPTIQPSAISARDAGLADFAP